MLFQCNQMNDVMNYRHSTGCGSKGGEIKNIGKCDYFIKYVRERQKHLVDSILC